MAEVQVQARGATVEVRSVKLTRALLKQLREIQTLPEAWCERDAEGKLVKVKDEFVIGWIDGSVLAEEHTKLVLCSNGKGDLYLWGRGLMFRPERYYKQLYI
jgi:hypothetical protein